MLLTALFVYCHQQDCQEESAVRELSTTSYAFLGLLAERPFTTYELTQQVRVLGAFWPRTERQLYEQPKLLVERGLATAERDYVGRRARTVYRITPMGRRALKAWLAQPGGDWGLESESLLKVFFSDHGTKSNLLCQLQALRDKNRQDDEAHRALAQTRLADRPFANRMHVNALVSRFFVELSAAIDRWVDWAESEVETWPAVAEPPDDIDALWARVFDL